MKKLLLISGLVAAINAQAADTKKLCELVQNTADLSLHKISTARRASKVLQYGLQNMDQTGNFQLQQDLETLNKKEQELQSIEQQVQRIKEGCNANVYQIGQAKKALKTLKQANSEINKIKKDVLEPLAWTWVMPWLSYEYRLIIRCR